MEKYIISNIERFFNKTNQSFKITYDNKTLNYWEKKCLNLK
jgi:hypothetical protein